ncbi:deferrochelatase/peroxidase EfeB [Nitrosospira sp. Nsp2]|uniref:Dyp-type peroxidase n=1 Tax=Nitrosospira sp. Nsp2 TaxID=136548 RepID=UPI000D323C8B|nr:peroxidase [Nitrosospira sp. Nsp2]PTR17432.1 deferrochelatase/peroxidase EfeB [Nitrosospira sp. Nsp2]
MTMPDLAHADIQGFILRTYAMPALRVFALKVVEPQAARHFLGELVKGASSSQDLPQLATATDWTVQPSYCLNVGLTYPGLAALGVPPDSLSSFPEEFAAGAVARAERVGDTGRSSPENWIGQLASPNLHVLLFLFAQTEDVMEQVTTRIRAMYASDGAMSELSLQEARSLPESKAHFGYRDGFAQPTIDGGLPHAMPDVLPKAPAGEFLFGHPSQYADFTYPAPIPPALGENGSFAAFRILSQDCDGFEQFLTEAAIQTGLDRELIAAKLCGRWRNGVPLSLSPDSPGDHIPLEKRNSFDYVPSTSVPDAFDDRRGYRCPLGSHIRRMNPRNSVVAGNSGLKRRIIRRGLPYGPPYDPLNPGDGIDRGLLGLFIGVSIKDQFEFLMSEWANKGSFAPGLRDTRDPIIGDNSVSDATFLIPVQGQKRPIELSGLSSFVNCRGAAYCFLPSATAIRYISALSPSPA